MESMSLTYGRALRNTPEEPFLTTDTYGHGDFGCHPMWMAELLPALFPEW